MPVVGVNRGLLCSPPQTFLELPCLLFSHQATRRHGLSHLLLLQCQGLGRDTAARSRKLHIGAEEAWRSSLILLLHYVPCLRLALGIPHNREVHIVSHPEALHL